MDAKHWQEIRKMDEKFCEEVFRFYEKFANLPASVGGTTHFGFDFEDFRFKSQSRLAAPEPQAPPRFLQGARYDHFEYLVAIGELERLPSKEDRLVFRALRPDLFSPEASGSPSRDPTRLVLTPEPDEPAEAAAPASATARALRNAAAAANRAQDLRFGAQGFAAK